MVEKIIVDPAEVRGLGDILEVKGTSDYTLYDSTLTAGTDTVYGATANVFVLEKENNYLFYDACDSATGLSNYGEVVPISSSTTTSYLEYNSAENAYLVHANGDWGVIPITALNGLTDYKITCKIKTRGSGNTYQGGVGFRAQSTTDNIIFREYSTDCNSVINDSSQQSIGTLPENANSRWYKFEITKQGQSFSITVTDTTTNNVVGTQSRSVSFTPYYCGLMVVAGQNYGSYVKDIVVESV